MTDEWIIDVTAANFRTEVIERSLKTPVVVDFWAEWCGPCKTLGPLLEKHAREGKGRFVLAKVDVDRNPELAQAFQVQGIPSVLGLRDGKMVDGFQGALPEAELKQFLDRIAPGPAGGGELERARELAAAGDHEQAISVLRAHLRENAGDAEARIELASILIDAGKPVDARKVFDKLDEKALETDAGKALKTKLAYAETAGDLEELAAAVEAAPEDPGKRIEYGKALVAAQRHADGLEQLLEAVELDPKFDGEAARKAMVEVFEMLGPEDEVANDFRYRLSLLLFS